MQPMKNGQHLDPDSDHRSLPETSVFAKKTYVSPELQEWGSVVDLTRGKKAQLEDAPAKGGTFVI